MNTARGKWYDIESVKAALPPVGFDLLLVDGPMGTNHFSRAGVVDWFLSNCPKDWLVIWDDLDRRADLESFALFLETARAKGMRCDSVFCCTGRTVGLAFTEKFRAVRYYF